MSNTMNASHVALQNFLNTSGETITAHLANNQLILMKYSLSRPMINLINSNKNCYVIKILDLIWYALELNKNK